MLCVFLGACGANGQTGDTGQTSTEDTTIAEGSTSESMEREETASDVTTSEDSPSSVSNIAETADVPLITLNNGVQVPQLGLGTQIQSLEQDASADGRQLLNQTSHDAVVTALQAGYRHLDTAHGYFNECSAGHPALAYAGRSVCCTGFNQSRSYSGEYRDF